jgi:hypothetical protein
LVRSWQKRRDAGRRLEPEPAEEQQRLSVAELEWRRASMVESITRRRKADVAA